MTLENKTLFIKIIFLYNILSRFQLSPAIQVNYTTLLESKCALRCQQEIRCQSWKYDFGSGMCIILLYENSNYKNQSIGSIYELYDYENDDENDDLNITAEVEQEDSVIKSHEQEQEFSENVTDLNSMTTMNYSDASYTSLLNQTSYYIIFKNRKYNGNYELYQLYTSTSEECCEICKREIRCMSWWRLKHGRDKGKCVLNSDLIGYVNNKHYDGGYFE